MSFVTVVSLLTHLQILGIKLWVKDGQLHYCAPDGAMTSDLRGQEFGRNRRAR